jgi:hypothetical protein
MHVFDVDGTTSAGQTDANIRGRQGMLRLLRFVRTLPGCENARLRTACMDTAIRETYRIVGETCIVVDDYLAGRIYDDAVCYAYYPLDIHDEQGAGPGGHDRVLPDEAAVPTVSLGALVPRDSLRILAAGRCVSSDRLSNSALRVQAPCMAMGQAAGAAAALGVQKDMPSRAVPVSEIRDLLKKHNAIVP